MRLKAKQIPILTPAPPPKDKPPSISHQILLHQLGPTYRNIGNTPYIVPRDSWTK